MKKLLTLLLVLVTLTATAQNKPEPKDSTIQVTVSLNEFRALLAVIDASIDSKKTSKELLEFLQKNAKLLTPPVDPADKPKASTTPKKN